MDECEGQENMFCYVGYLFGLLDGKKLGIRSMGADWWLYGVTRFSHIRLLELGEEWDRQNTRRNT